MRLSPWIAAGLLLLFRAGPGFACEPAADMPAPVPLLRNEYLGLPRYRELAGAWSAYSNAHPQTALAYVHLWRAQSYSSQAGWADGVRLIQKAYAIDPDCAEVLNELAQLQFGPSVNTGRPAPAEIRRWSERAIELRPDWYDPHVNLLVQSMVAGDRDDARTQLRAMVRKQGFPAVLLDYGHNLLVNAAPNAILITNGDNDTFAALAVQALHGIREDVSVVNASLLNMAPYVRTVFAAGAPFTSAELAAFESKAPQTKQPLVHQVIAALGAKVRTGQCARPVYFATTVPREAFEGRLGTGIELTALLWHVVPAAPASGGDPLFDAAATESLLTREFRLDSALDLARVASPVSSSGTMLQGLIRNYFGAWYRVAEYRAKEGDLPGVRRALRGALQVLRYNPGLQTDGATDWWSDVVAYWKSVDPGNPEITALERGPRP